MKPMFLMNKILALTALFCLSKTFIWAQQMPLFTQYREMQGILNPAAVPYSFFTDHHFGSIGVLSRKQWIDMPNPPTTQILRGDYFAADHTGVALLTGGYLINDQTGPTGFTGIYGRAAGVISSDPDVGGLSFGLALGGVQYRLKTSELKLRDANDLRATEDRSQWYPDLSIGAFFYQRLENDDYVYSGISVPQMMALDFKIPNGSNADYSLQRVRHYYATAGWYHFFGEGSFVEPSAWVKYVAGAPVNVDFNVRYQAANTFWIGAGSSLRGSIHAEAGFILGKNVGFDNALRFGYGFDYTTQSYGSFAGTTHEINLSYSF